MHRYTISKRLGDGTYGEVVAVNNQSGEMVAAKRMKRKYYSWDDCIALREVQSLRKLRHPNIVKLKEIIREMTACTWSEHMDCNLYELTKSAEAPAQRAHTEPHVPDPDGASLHAQKRLLPRDMKPEYSRPK